MPALLPKDTRKLLTGHQELPDGRSVLFDRFADPAAKEDDRREWFNRVAGKAAISIKAKTWPSIISSLGSVPFYAQLQSRLMVNMAGGVMENAGLCLDRFGLPYIPGSAVKGCARRMALAALREWSEAGGRSEHKPSGPDNPVAACCAPFTALADMLLAVAHTFGWADLDWSDRPAQSDFASACCDGWPDVREAVVRQLATELGVPLKPDDPKPWKKLPNFAGSVSFLPAYPLDATGADLPLTPPPLGKLELDVVTVHHKQYYNEPAEPKGVPQSHEKWQRWKRDHDAWEREWGSAPDIEEPVPNVFPAVAPGHVFAFALAPLRGANNDLLGQARTWLAQGLETFGLGAKTNAGYGWFSDVTPTVGVILKRQTALLTIQRKAEKFTALSDDDRLDFIIELAKRPELCRAWRKENPETAKEVDAFANEMGSPLP